MSRRRQDEEAWPAETGMWGEGVEERRRAKVPLLEKIGKGCEADGDL
jgi:hypothetical protein